MCQRMISNLRERDVVLIPGSFSEQIEHSVFVAAAPEAEGERNC